MKKITLLICLVIILNAPISAYAQATGTTPTVTIAAGTGAAVGGAYQGYTSKTAAAATALTIAILSATGAAVKLTEASVQAGKTVYQVINDKFAQWVGGTSAEELTPSEAEELQSRFKVITGGGGNSEDPDNDQNNGTNIGEDGKLWFSPGSLAMLKQFCDWLESTDQLKNYETSENNGTVDLGSLGQFDLLTTLNVYGNGWSNIYNTSSPAIFYKSFGQNLNIISNTPFTITFTRQDGTGANLETTAYRGYYYREISFSSFNANPTIESRNLSPTNFINSISRWNVQGGQTEIDNDGIYKGENYDSSILDNPNNQIFIVDPGILNGFNIDSDKQIAIPDYIDLIIQQAEQRAKKDAQSDQSSVPQELPVPLIDPLAGTKSPANWIDTSPDDAIQDPIDHEKRDPEPDDPKDPVIDHDTATDPEDAVELLKVDLTRIFPFCIPWDIYRLIEKFNADPVTPSLTIDWGSILGSIGVDFETTIDLHDYDGVAQVLRTMETVAFVIGLAVATRSIFLQS